ncbi:DUF3780 domain-containing protein [bacterium]|nr:DUF3780 domain-containing protein [bacterium]
MEKKNYLGFGFLPEESTHHFLVVIPKTTKELVAVFERHEWEPDAETQTKDLYHKKVEISQEKWQKVKEALQESFNQRLRKHNKPSGKWKIGQNPVERLLGKELILLLWAIEEADPALIGNAILNWQGLSEEERWWLFTMTNASSGNYLDKRGWRKAIRYALTENQISQTYNERDSQISSLFRERMEND